MRLTWTEHEHEISRYLLGDLPDDASSQLEERLFLDSDLDELRDRVEMELVEAYVRGELPDADKRLFEEHFMATPSRRDTVLIVQALIQEAREQAPPKKQPLSFPRILRAPAAAWAIAACLALLSFNLWFWQRDRGEPRLIALAYQAEGITSKSPVATAEPGNGKLTLVLALKPDSEPDRSYTAAIWDGDHKIAEATGLREQLLDSSRFISFTVQGSLLQSDRDYSVTWSAPGVMPSRQVFRVVSTK